LHERRGRSRRSRGAHKRSQRSAAYTLRCSSGRVFDVLHLLLAQESPPYRQQIASLAGRITVIGQAVSPDTAEGQDFADNDMTITEISASSQPVDRLTEATGAGKSKT
jgi:hypothetical protein